MHQSDLYPGLRVRIREWDDMAKEFVYTDSVIECNFSFVSNMRYLCGMEFTVAEVLENGHVLFADCEAEGDCVRIPNPEDRWDDIWAISSDMLVPVEPDSTVPDIDVHELCSLLNL